ncbi:uncharacterized protein LOC117705679 isoform X2 [Arvicanthis niloticus]|uniref:uncharacterized protein LOC117705679 isoform X2 n=1 Tax=Arvicanthis niloticus TaxID=61156 RepID=UPI00402B84D0
MSEAAYGFQCKGPCSRECGICMMMKVGKRDIAEQNSSKIAFLLPLGFTLSLAFPLPHPSFGVSEWSLLPLSHQLCKFLSVYLSPDSARQTSSQNSTINNQKQMTKLEELKLKIKKMSFEEEEISEMLNLYNYDDLNYRMNIEFNIMKRNHEKTIMNIQKITESITDAMERYKEVIEENYAYSTRHCQLLRECSQLKYNIRVLLQNANRNLLVEQSEPQVSYGEDKSFCEEANKNIYVPSAKHQQF